LLRDRRVPPALIVNADDFGRSAEINEAVRRALGAGVLTSASLMVTGAAVDEAVALARSYPRLAVGLHVVVADGAPALPADRIPHLVDATGQLRRSAARQGLQLVLQRAARAELARELEAQFERFAATGLALAHVDGHLHLHVHPVVFDQLLPLAVAYGARGFRIPADDHVLALRHSRRRLLAKLAWTATFALLGRRARRRLRRQPLASCDRTYGLLQSGAMDERYVLRVLRAIESLAGPAEIYFHPSIRDLGEPLGPNTTDLACLLSPAVRRAIAARSLRLATYPTLHEVR
jgi:chitin disaccharide deacetylase